MLRFLAVLMLLTALAPALLAEEAPPVEEKSAGDLLLDRVKAAGLVGKPFGLVVLFSAKQNQVEAMAAAAAKAETPSQAEEGCGAYTFHQNAEAPTEFVLLERWRDAEALEAHFATPHFQELVAKFDELLDEPPVIRIVR